MPHASCPRLWKLFFACRIFVGWSDSSCHTGSVEPNMCGRGVSCPADVVNVDPRRHASGSSRTGTRKRRGPAACQTWRANVNDAHDIGEHDLARRRRIPSLVRVAATALLIVLRPSRATPRIVVAVLGALFYSCISRRTPFPTGGFRPFRLKRIDENATIIQVAALRRTLRLVARVHDRRSSTIHEFRQRRGIFRPAFRRCAWV